MESIKQFIRRKFSIKEIIIFIFILATLRVLIEWALLEYPIELDGTQDYIRFYLENLYYFIIAFLLISIILFKIAKKSFLEITNFGIRLYPVILLPPLIDYFIYNQTKGYDYATKGNFIYNFLTISLLKGDASNGIIIELLIAVIAIGLYTYYSRKSLLLALISIFLTTFIIALISTPDIFFGESKGDFYYDYFLPIYYFFPLIVLSSMLYYFHSKEKLKSILFGFRPLLAIIFILATFIGSLAAKSLGYSLNFYYVAYAIIAIFFVRQFSVVLNDIYDYNIDKISNKERPLVKKILNKEEHKNLALIFTGLAISFSAIINLKVLFLIVLGLILGFLYSVPPFRLRKSFLGQIIIGISLILCFAVGFLVVNDLAYILNIKNIQFCTILFFFGLVTSFTKDFKDIKGDSRNKVINFYTLFGKEKGKNIVTALLFLVLNLPTFFIREITFLTIALILSIITSYLYYKKGDERIVYFISSLLGIYTFIMLYYF